MKFTFDEEIESPIGNSPVRQSKRLKNKRKRLEVPAKKRSNTLKIKFKGELIIQCITPKTNKSSRKFVRKNLKQKFMKETSYKKACDKLCPEKFSYAVEFPDKNNKNKIVMKRFPVAREDTERVVRHHIETPKIKNGKKKLILVKEKKIAEKKLISDKVPFESDQSTNSKNLEFENLNQENYYDFLEDKNCSSELTSHQDEEPIDIFLEHFNPKIVQQTNLNQNQTFFREKIDIEKIEKNYLVKLLGLDNKSYTHNKLAIENNQSLLKNDYRILNPKKTNQNKEIHSQPFIKKNDNENEKKDSLYIISNTNQKQLIKIKTLDYVVPKFDWVQESISTTKQKELRKKLINAVNFSGSDPKNDYKQAKLQMDVDSFEKRKPHFIKT